MTKQEGRTLALSIFGFITFGAAGYVIFVSPPGFSNLPKEQAAAVQTSLPVHKTSVPFVQIIRGSKSSATAPESDLVSSPEQLASLWKLIGATSTPPTIDFSRSSLIAVFAGQTSDPTARVDVTQIIDSTDRHLVLTITDSGVACTGSCPLISPYQVIQVPLTSLPTTSEYAFTTLPGAKLSPMPAE